MFKSDGGFIKSKFNAISGSGIASFYNGREAVLLVDKVTKDFLGKYVCKATNIAGTATSTCVISLVEPTPKPVEVQIEKSKPSFYVPLKNQARFLGFLSFNAL